MAVRKVRKPNVQKAKVKTPVQKAPVNKAPVKGVNPKSSGKGINVIPRKTPVNQAKNAIQQAKQNKPNKVGRPKSFHPFRSFHNAAAGETRNSPTTDPNIIFFAAGGLIVVSSWSRITTVFSYAWGNKTTHDAAKNPEDFWSNLKIILVQLLFVFLLTFVARIAPPLARIFLVIVIGTWILYLMRNPQVLYLLKVAGK